MRAYFQHFVLKIVFAIYHELAACEQFRTSCETWKTQGEIIFFSRFALLSRRSTWLGEWNCSQSNRKLRIFFRSFSLQIVGVTSTVRIVSSNQKLVARTPNVFTSASRLVMLLSNVSPKNAGSVIFRRWGYIRVLVTPTATFTEVRSRAQL